MVKFLTLICLLIIFYTLISCQDFPLPYKEKDKNFEPTAEIISPNNYEYIPYQDTISFLIVANDIEDKTEELKVTLTSDIDGDLYSGISDIYGQVFLTGFLRSYAQHRITLSVEDKSGNVSTAEVIINYNIPNRIQVTSSEINANSVNFSWIESKTPDNKFDKYEVYRSVGNDSNRFELIKTIENKNDVAFNSSEFLIGKSYYRVDNIDKDGNVTQSPLIHFGIEKEIYPFEDFDNPRSMVVSEKYNKLFVNAGYHGYTHPYYEQLVVIDLENYTLSTIDFPDNVWNDIYLSDDEENLHMGLGESLVLYNIASNSITEEYVLDTWPTKILKLNNNEFIYTHTTHNSYIHYLNISQNIKIQIKRDQTREFDQPSISFNKKLNYLYIKDRSNFLVYELSGNQFIQKSLGQDFLGDVPLLINSELGELYAREYIYSADNLQLIEQNEHGIYRLENEGELLRSYNYFMPASNRNTKYLFPWIIQGEYAYTTAYIKSSNKLLMYDPYEEELHVFDLSFLFN